MKLTICGSIAFYSEMEALKSELEARGHEVLIPLISAEIPELNGERKLYFAKYLADRGGIDNFESTHSIWDIKNQAIRDHFDKIVWGDAVVVANYEKHGISGYIGGNTLIEMGLAFFLKKPIYVLNVPSSALSYKAEVLAMRPIFLRGELGALPRSA